MGKFGRVTYFDFEKQDWILGREIVILAVLGDLSSTFLSVTLFGRIGNDTQRSLLGAAGAY
jgi:hypothetical protein